jgi:hypothetical protein
MVDYVDDSSSSNYDHQFTHSDWFAFFIFMVCLDFVVALFVAYFIEMLKEVAE